MFAPPAHVSVVPGHSVRMIVRGLVSGYSTAIPFWLAPCWKKPFSEQLSAVHVKPESHINTGALCNAFVVTCGGRYRLKFISVPVTFDWCASFSSLPPKEAIVAFVVIDMIV